MFNANGDKQYEGEWLDDEYNGYGTVYYENGVKYVGKWINGQKSG